MDGLRRWARRVWFFLNRRRLERELEREMAVHRALMDDPRRFGSPLRLREQSADVWGWTAVDDLWHDVRYAARVLRRAPAFAAAAIATLALGIGASTAIFSVAYGVSLRPLPYPDAGRLIRIYEANPTDGLLKQDVSEGAFQDWRGAASLDSAAMYGPVATRFLARSADPVATMTVSAAFFDVLGVPPMIGRGFDAGREYAFGRSDEAVLSFAGWQRLFGARSDVVGATLALRGARGDDVVVVVGVMPPEFRFAEPVDFWRVAALRAPVPPMVRNWRYDRVIARMEPAASVDAARAELEAIAARLAREFPRSNQGWTVTVEPLREATIGAFGRATWLLLAAVAVVLLVACVNVAGLLLARTVSRAREIAVREALGAARWRLLRLWLAEGILLGALGATLGVALASLGVLALKTAAPPGIPRLDDVIVDVPVLAVAVLAALVAVVTITVAPLRTRPAGAGSHRDQVAARLHAGTQAAGDPPKMQAMRHALVLAQCTGAVMLVVLSALLARSLVKLVSYDLGWNPERTLSLSVNPPMPPELLRPWYRYVEWSDRLIAQLEATPGVERAAITTGIPFSSQFIPAVIARGRATDQTDTGRWAGVVHHVTDGYFDVMEMRLLSGRTFGAADRATEAQLTYVERPDSGVAIVSNRLARTLWPGGNAIGKTIWLPDLGDVPWREVVGVVDDPQFHTVGEVPAYHVFVPWTQRPTGGPLLLVRGTGSTASLAPLVRAVVERVEPGTGVDRVVALDALVSRATAQPRFMARTVAAFGVTALVLAAIGIYATLSYLLGARTREIAIRLSLGAPPWGMLPGMLRRGLWPVAAGGVAGLVLAAALARTFESLLFEVEPIDPASFAAGGLLMLVAATAAALAPVRRAIRVDPAAALRAE